VSPQPWSADQVLALAPDASSQKAARSLASPGSWPERGSAADPPSLWGLCRGSGSNPYQTCVDLTEPAYRCSCPSRKLPCKHVLGLMLMWAGGNVPAGSPPEWLTEWLAGRADRKEKAAERAATRPPAQRDPKTAQRRVERMTAGVDELERWLADQVRQGLAGASHAGYRHWDTMAARLVDAQATGLASSVRRLAAVAGSPDQLLTELSLLRLLAAGYRRLDELPEDLAATVRTRVGVPVATADVLAGPRERDAWTVTGVRDSVTDDRATFRRTYLHGSTGRPALVLAFAAPGQPLPVDLLIGTSVDADVCFYPGSLPLRALVAERYGPPEPVDAPPGAVPVGTALARYAEALAAEPWLELWPMLLAPVTPVLDGAGQWHLRDEAGDALPLDPVVGAPWRLVSLCGGGPATVAAEWSPSGLRPMTAWIDGRMAST
jgi:SWIM zinc finger